MSGVTAAGRAETVIYSEIPAEILRFFFIDCCCCRVGRLFGRVVPANELAPA